MLKDGLTGGDTSSNGLAQILQGKEESVDYAHMPAQIAEILKKAPMLPPEHYAALLKHLQFTGRQYRDFHLLPYPPNALIFPPQGWTSPADAMQWSYL